MKYLEPLTKPPFKTLETLSEGFFTMFPDLPKSWTKFFAKFVAPIALISGIIEIISLFSGFSDKNYLVALAQLISSVLLIAAYKPLKHRRKFGLTLLFWNALLYGSLNLIWNLSSSVVLSTAVSLYFIEQLRPHFTKK